MKCLYCSHNETQVIDSRDSDDVSSVRRRRICMKCEKRFTTYERADVIDLVVIKKDDSREQFDRNKVLVGLKRACEKRPISMETIKEVTDEIEQALRKYETTEIPSKVIGEMIIKKLKVLDKVAYIRFASVYREFEDVESFEKEVQKLLGSKKVSKGSLN